MYSLFKFLNKQRRKKNQLKAPIKKNSIKKLQTFQKFPSKKSTNSNFLLKSQVVSLSLSHSLRSILFVDFNL